MMDDVLQDLYKRIWNGAEITFCGRTDNRVRIVTKEYNSFDDYGGLYTISYFTLTPDSATRTYDLADDNDWIV